MSFIGVSSPVVIQSSALLEISYSDNITISNIVFKCCDGYQNVKEIFDSNIFNMHKNGYYTNLLVDSCSNVTITNISFWNHNRYGIVGISVARMIYLENILLNVPQKCILA